MTIRAVRIFGDPVLRTRAEEVTEFDETLATLVDDMLDTMDDADGVGLAANQIGVTRRVFVYDCSHEVPGARGHIINPVWEPVGEEKQVGPEGCLSIPEISKDTERYQKVVVRGVDKQGEPIEFECDGLLARCVQHETDHLDGVLFLQRLAPALRKEAMAEIRNSEWFNA
ncbi:peptide deformylase [Corynebacterium hindlerae]|uniref:Peptide deformylase n=1 Tax=Corynebacterium hindlerae TaxID=699041 RepID=A0A7G5FFI8_9CORY|nr:peptide deformylase [Corynebacterium hindlerae]QMV85379.1 peptide deformylase [Corynebacterium hindlerae]QTH58743.1 peptide deformylase [Corynebacterium hindlerae]